jgi:hypothetical protein
MFSLSQIIATIVVVVVTVLVTVLIQKGIRSIQDAKIQREEAIEHEELLEATVRSKETKFITTDGLVEGYIKDYEIESISLKGGKSYSSFEDLFAHEKMPTSTYKELVEAQASLVEIQNNIKEDMYVPKFYTTMNTTEELGRDVVIYRQGDIRLTDRLIITIGENSEKEVDTVKVLMSYGSLEDTSRSIFALNFLVTEDDPQEKVDDNKKLFFQLLSKPTFKVEADKMRKVGDDLDFYNQLVKEDKIYFYKGRAHLRTILDVKEETFVSQSPVVDDIESIVKNAIDGRSDVTE